MSLFIDQRERPNSLQEAIRTALQGWQAGLWTALPCIVQSYDPTKETCVLQPAIQAQITAADGSTTQVNLPLLVDVPTQFPSGGGFTLTFPVKQGDEAIAVFASRCLDSWWQSGGVQRQAELRMHDLSDAMAIVGFRSLPRTLSGFSTTSAQLRKDDGTAFLEITTTGSVNITAPGGFNVTTPTASFSAAVTAAGEVKSTLGGTHTLTQHQHHQGADSHGDAEQDVGVPFN